MTDNETLTGAEAGKIPTEEETKKAEDKLKEWRQKLSQLEEEQKHRRSCGRILRYQFSDGQLRFEISNAKARVSELEREVRRLRAAEDRERMFASHAKGPLSLAGMFVLETLKRHERYNRKTLEYVVSQELGGFIRPSGELVIEGLVRRGLVAKDGAWLCLTEDGGLESARMPELEPELKRLAAVPDFRFACELENVLDWLTLLEVKNIRNFCTTETLPEHVSPKEKEFIDTLPEAFMEWHMEDLIKEGLVSASSHDLIIIETDAARAGHPTVYCRLKHVHELTKKGVDKLSPAVSGPRAGGKYHKEETATLTERFQQHDFHTWVGYGTLAGSHPDLVPTPPSKHAGRGRHWDRTKQIAVEVEQNPTKHPDDARSNYIRNVAHGLPTFFSVFDGRQGKAVANAIKKLRYPKVLAAAVQKEKSLSDEQREFVADQIRKHRPKMVAMSFLFGFVVNKLLGQKPTAFGVFIRVVPRDLLFPMLRPFIRKCFKVAMKHGTKFEIEHRKDSYYLRQRIGRKRFGEEKIPPWLALWLIKHGAKMWKKH